MLQFIALLTKKFFRVPRSIVEFFKDMANMVISERIVKRVLFLFLLIVFGVTNANSEAEIMTTCNNSTVQVNIKFSRPFQGIVYTTGNFFNPLCSQSPHPDSVREIFLNLPFDTCISRIEEMTTGVRVSSTIFIQKHQLIKTTLDSIHNISCELPFSLNSLQLSPHESATRTVSSRPRMVLWLDLKVGTDLFQDGETRDEDVESSLYIVIKLADRSVHHDLVVRNCIAHDETVISNETTLYVMSDTYGCSDSRMLSNFTVTNQTDGFSNIMAYAMIKNITMFAKGQLYMTCGVSLCRSTCQNRCGGNESNKPNITNIVSKKIAKRLPEVTTPSSLRIFEDRAHTVQKRSVLDNVFGFLSRIVSRARRPISTKALISAIPSKENETIFESSLETTRPSNNESVDLTEPNVMTDLHNVSHVFEALSRVNLSSDFQVKSTEVSTSTSFYVEPIENDSVSFEPIHQPHRMQSSISMFDVLLATTEHSILQQPNLLQSSNPELLPSETPAEEYLNSSTCLPLNTTIKTPTEEYLNSSICSLNATINNSDNFESHFSWSSFLGQFLITVAIFGSLTLFNCIAACVSMSRKGDLLLEE